MSARATAKTSSQQLQLPGADASCDLSSLSAHIATELAVGLSTAADIRERYGISLAQWDRLKKSPQFRNMLAEAVRLWQGDQNAGARIQKKADVVLEDAIPAYDGMIHAKDIAARDKIEAGKLLAALAGRSAKNEGGAPAGGGFTLNINLGGGREKLVIDGKNLPVPLEAE
jgi:hypothetical protein